MLVRKIVPTLAAIALGSLLAAGCAGSTPIDVSDDDDDGGATFSGDAFPALKTENCGLGGCHLTGAPQGGLALPDAGGALSQAAAYAALSAGGNSGPALDTSSPSDSLLLTKGLNTVAHAGGQQWTTGDSTYQAVRSWIAAGAPNN